MQSPLPQDLSRMAGCPGCEKYPLEDLGTELVCSACLCRYQVVNDVPILVPGVTQSRCFAPSDEFVQRIAAIYDLPSTVRARIRDVFSLAWTIPNVAQSGRGGSTMSYERRTRLASSNGAAAPRSCPWRLASAFTRGLGIAQVPRRLWVGQPTAARWSRIRASLRRRSCRRSLSHRC